MMPLRPPRHQHAGYRPNAQRDREHDKRRGSSRDRGYNAQWEKAGKLYLASHPWCEMCRRDGRFTAATLVDHILAHRGDQTKFWDQNNWQGLCRRHHDRDKQRAERGPVREDVRKLFPIPE
jgi:5-methylcytosine-specific restriction protein A